MGDRKHVSLSGEMGTDHGEDIWRYPGGNVERVHEVPRVGEHGTDPFLIVSSLTMGKLSMSGEINRPRTSSRVKSGGFFWLMGRQPFFSDIDKQEPTNTIVMTYSRNACSSCLTVNPLPGKVSPIEGFVSFVAPRQSWTQGKRCGG